MCLLSQKERGKEEEDEDDESQKTNVRTEKHEADR